MNMSINTNSIVAFSRNSSRFVSVQDGRLLSGISPSQFATVDHGKCSTDMAGAEFSPCNRYFAAWSEAAEISVFDTLNPSWRSRFNLLPGPVSSCMVLSDQELYVVATDYEGFQPVIIQLDGTSGQLVGEHCFPSDYRFIGFHCDDGKSHAFMIVGDRTDHAGSLRMLDLQNVAKGTLDDCVADVEDAIDAVVGRCTKTIAVLSSKSDELKFWSTATLTNTASFSLKYPTALYDFTWVNHGLVCIANSPSVELSQRAWLFRTDGTAEKLNIPALVSSDSKRVVGSPSADLLLGVTKDRFFCTKAIVNAKTLEEEAPIGNMHMGSIKLSGDGLFASIQFGDYKNTIATDSN